MMSFVRTQKRNEKRRGFTLIELAIVLAVAALLFAGLWRLLSSGNTQLRDQAAAELHRQLITAVSSFLNTTEGQNWMAKMAANGVQELALPTTNDDETTCKAALGVDTEVLCEYLPVGFRGGTSNPTTNAYGQRFRVMVRKDNTAVNILPNTYSFMVATFDGDEIPDTSGGRIASSIGNDGGFVYTTNVCGTDFACGAFGAWSVALSTYNFGDVTSGHIASRTYSDMSSELNPPWLARQTLTGPVVTLPDGTSANDYNTLQANTYLGYMADGTTVASIFGSTGAQYYGGIFNIREMTLGRLEDVGPTPLRIVANSCVKTALDGSDNCDYAMEVNGSASVTGLLMANKLYAAVFIYDTQSDRTMKDNIKPIQNALDKFSKIGAYSFEMKQTGEKKLGVIAQEVEEVFPELVHQIGNGYKGVDYPGLIGPLVAAVKELKQEVDTLRSEVKGQAETIRELRKGTGVSEKSGAK